MKFRCQSISGTVLAAATLAGVAIINVNPTILADAVHFLEATFDPAQSSAPPSGPLSALAGTFEMLRPSR